jgi:competence protein ComEA
MSDASPGGKPERRTNPEALAVVSVLVALLVVLVAHVLVSRWLGRELPLERLPEHRFDYQLDVNTANQMELIHLPGIGPKLADRIVADREANGPFRSLDDLERVRGIGPKLARDIAPYLRWPAEP